jgi:hypothetical protein
MPWDARNSPIANGKWLYGQPMAHTSHAVTAGRVADGQPLCGRHFHAVTEPRTVDALSVNACSKDETALRLSTEA